MFVRGIGETKGEKGPDSTESESPIHGLRERGRGQAVVKATYTGLFGVYNVEVVHIIQNVASYDLVSSS